MVNKLLVKGGAVLPITRIGIGTVSLAVVSVAIWTGTVVKAPKSWIIPAVTVVAQGAKKLFRKQSIRHEIILSQFATRLTQLIVKPLTLPIPIVSPGGVVGIRGPP